MPWYIIDSDTKQVIDSTPYASYDAAKESPAADLDDVLIVEVATEEIVI